jgi:co-chaperonin GroES (HSP10)
MANTMRPARGLLLVRPVETDDLQRGIVLLSDTRERMTQAQCEVIAVGEPAICEDEECEREHVFASVFRNDGVFEKPWVEHPCPVRIGDWLLVRPRSFIDGPTPERAEWFVHQDDVLAILNED